MSLKWHLLSMTTFGLLFSLNPQSGDAAMLIARWEFEDSGNLGLDSTANANHGTVNGDVSQVAGKNGHGAFFDGTGDYISKTNLAGGYTAGSGGYTFAAWVKHDAAASGFDAILTQGIGSGFTFRLLVNSADTLYVNAVGEPDRTLTGNTITDGVWTHVAMTGEQSAGPNRTGKVYLNGVLVNTFSQGGALPTVGPTHTTLIGGSDGGTLHQWRGVMDDVRVYQGALTESEIATLAGVPEPASLSLLLLGAILVNCFRRRRRSLA